MKLAITFLLFATCAASAAELRPLGTQLCLTANIVADKPAGPLTVAPCAGKPDQQFRGGKQKTITSDGARCLQAVRIKEQPDHVVVAARCHGLTGQRWSLTRGGQLVNDTRKCLTSPPGAGTVTLSECETGPNGNRNQKWALYGQFE